MQLPNSRAAETEADQIGIELAAKAGYDPRAAITLWQKMGKVGGSAPPAFLSTHPSDAQRQERLAKLAPKMMPLLPGPGVAPHPSGAHGPGGRLTTRNHERRSCDRPSRTSGRTRFNPRTASVSDDYYWLRDDTRTEPDVLEYLRAEDDYRAADAAAG